MKQNLTTDPSTCLRYLKRCLFFFLGGGGNPGPSLRPKDTCFKHSWGRGHFGKQVAITQRQTPKSRASLSLSSSEVQESSYVNTVAHWLKGIRQVIHTHAQQPPPPPTPPGHWIAVREAQTCPPELRPATLLSQLQRQQYSSVTTLRYVPPQDLYPCWTAAGPLPLGVHVKA